MGERTYPRKWYRVGRHGGNFEEREFLRETDKKLFWQGRHREEQVLKTTSYDIWYPTKEEANAAITLAQESNRRMKALSRARNAGPALLAALETLLDTCGARGAYHALDYSKAVEAAEAAIAQAKGE